MPESLPLPTDLYPGESKAESWAKAVQLDQEAKGNLIREVTNPLRWYRVQGSYQLSANTLTLIV